MMLTPVSFFPSLGIVINPLHQSLSTNTQVAYGQYSSQNKLRPNKKAKTNNANHRAGDWVCLLCNNHNYSFRKICNRCQSQSKKQNLIQSLALLNKASDVQIIQNPQASCPVAELDEPINDIYVHGKGVHIENGAIIGANSTCVCSGTHMNKIQAPPGLSPPKTSPMQCAYEDNKENIDPQLWGCKSSSKSLKINESTKFVNSSTMNWRHAKHEQSYQLFSKEMHAPYCAFLKEHKDSQHLIDSDDEDYEDDGKDLELLRSINITLAEEMDE